jgi:hypothetical protein
MSARGIRKRAAPVHKYTFQVVPPDNDGSPEIVSVMAIGPLAALKEVGTKVPAGSEIHAVIKPE